MTIQEKYDHPEFVALLETVRKNAADDAPRLILSDWLEDHDLDSAAKFIRGQIAGELVAAPLTWLIQVEGVLGTDPHNTGRIACMDDPVDLSLGRARGVDAGTPLVFASVHTHAGLELKYRRGFVSEALVPAGQYAGRICKQCKGQGLVSKATGAGPEYDRCPKCPPTPSGVRGTGWIDGVAGELFKRQPVQSVQVTVKSPHGPVSNRDATFYWFRAPMTLTGTLDAADAAHQLPAPLYDCLTAGRQNPLHRAGPFSGLMFRGYQTEYLAMADLADAAVTLGRRLAEPLAPGDWPAPK